MLLSTYTTLDSQLSFLTLLENSPRGNRLNNCIGRSNYRFFVALLLSTFFMTSIQLGLSAWFVVKFHVNNQEFRGKGAFVSIMSPIGVAPRSCVLANGSLRL